MARVLLPLMTDIPFGAETYSYDILTKRGAAEIFTSATTRIPLVDIELERKTRRLPMAILGFQVTDIELEQARIANRPIETYKVDAVRRGLAEWENSLAIKGDTTLGIPGLVNAVGIQVLDAENGAGSSPLWENKTPAEIAEDVRKVMVAINKYRPHKADTLALPADQYGMLQRSMGGTDTRTIEKYIRDNGWFSVIVQVDELSTAGDNGSAAILAMESDNDVAELLIPGHGTDIQRKEPVRVPIGYQVPIYEQCGGAIVRFPLAIARMDGV
jgi:hypothetical protein